MTRTMVNDMRRRLRGLPPPEPPRHLLAKILDSRSAGARVALPRVRRTRASWLIGALAVAAVFALVILTHSHERPVRSNDSDYGDIASALAVWPPEALAQEVGPRRAPSYAVVRALRGADVQGGRWSYRICHAFDDDVRTELTKCRERLSIVIRAAVWQGRPAWLVSQQGSWRGDGGDARRSQVDTMYANRETLRPIYYALVGDQFRMIHRFTWDTVHEELDIGGPYPRSWHTYAQIPGAVDVPLVLRWRWYDAALLLQAVPLDRGWRGSVYSVGLVSRDPSKAQIEPVDLRVARSERVEVPAGTFDCWKIVARERGGVTITFWTSKVGRWLVKMEERGPDWRSERALVSTSLPEP